VAALAALGVVGVLVWPGPGIAVVVFQTGLCLYCVLHRQLFAADPAVLAGP
jgi:hypothetical protein